MSKTRDTGFLGNVIKVDTNGNVSFVSGSTTLATINTSGQLSGSSPVLSSSYALNADLLDGLDSTQFTLTSSFAAQTASFTAFTASVNSFTASQLVLNGTYATTGSNTFAGIQTINSNLVVTGSITAQTLVVQTITSSVDFVTGSTRFGSVIGNTHVFTGSMAVSGSATFTSTLTTGDVITTNTGGFRTLASQGYALRNDANSANLGGLTRRSYWAGNAALDTQIFAESGYGIFLNVNGSNSAGLNISSSGNVGIGVTNPSGSLSIKAETSNTPTIVFQPTTGVAPSAISNFLGAYQTFTVIGSNAYVNNVGSIVRFNTNYAGCYIAFDEGDIGFGVGTSGGNPSQKMRITSAGNVGIGTTSPSTLFQTNQTGVNGYFYSGQQSGTEIAYWYYSATEVQFSSKSATRALTFLTSDVERMRITSGGVTAIAASSNTSDLGSTGLVIGGSSVLTSGNVLMLNFIPIGHTSNRARAGIGCLVGADWGKGNLTFYTQDASSGAAMTTANERMRITSEGTVCIGTTQSSRNLNVYDSIGVRTNRRSVEEEIFFIGATGSGVNDGYLVLQDNGVRKVLIAASNARGGDTYFNGGGNVGIGTDAPSYKLHVNGTAYATGAAGALSDIRHKNNVLNINAGLDAVMLLRPISYSWNEELITDDGMQGLHFGFIAQEVKEILPDVILEQNNEEKTLGLKYNEIIPILVKAIQEQQTQINELKAQING